MIMHKGAENNGSVASLIDCVFHPDFSVIDLQFSKRSLQSFCTYVALSLKLLLFSLPIFLLHHFVLSLLYS